MSASDATTIADALRALAQEARGRPFAEDALGTLGGWDRVAADASNLQGESTLPLLANLVGRDAPAEPDPAMMRALVEVADAAAATAHPALFRDSIEPLLASPGALKATGDRLAVVLNALVQEFLARDERDRHADLRAADALDALTRLAVAGYGSHFALLGLLQRFTAPTATPMAIAVIRSVSTVIDLWPEADILGDIPRKLAGIDSDTNGDRTLAAEVESDATWALATIGVLRTLRAESLEQMTPHLEDAARYLRVAAETHQREDAAILRQVIETLHELVDAIVAGTSIEALNSTHLAADTLNQLAEHTRAYNITASGLHHWYGDSKRAVLLAWSHLASDLGRLRTEFEKDAFYRAEVIVDDLLRIYVGTRSYTLHRRDADTAGVRDLVQPVIEFGFAAKAGLMSNLEDHAEELKKRVASEPSVELQQQLAAADSLIEAARSVAKGGTGLGKGNGGAPSAPLPPPLSRLFPAGSPDEAALRGLSPSAISALAESLDHVANARTHLNIIATEVFDNIRAALIESPDYKDDVVIVVDEVLLLIVNFVVSRTSAESGHYKYLFDATANEAAIHEDLYNYLVGNLGGRAEYEVSHVGGGRVDLRLKFDRFAIHIEMKVDDTKVAMSNKTAYLKQAAAYQGNDIRIGFLIALRHKAFDPKGAPPHLSKLIEHTKFDIDGDPQPRHIILVQIPGSRTKPSASK